MLLPWLIIDANHESSVPFSSKKPKCVIMQPFTLHIPQLIIYPFQKKGRISFFFSNYRNIFTRVMINENKKPISHHNLKFLRNPYRMFNVKDIKAPKKKKRRKKINLCKTQQQTEKKVKVGCRWLCALTTAHGVTRRF